MAMGDIVELSEIPFINRSRLDGGFIASLTFFADEWRIWLQLENKRQFMESKAWPAEGFYWARRRERLTDQSNIFLNFVAQHANYPSMLKSFAALQDDIFNIASSFAKFDLIFGSGTTHDGCVRMACCEVEFLLTVCRSVFDLMQEILAAIWNHVVLIDPKVRKGQLKRTFSGMTICAKRLLTTAEIASRSSIPLQFANCYSKYSPVFEHIRQLRDDIVHRGYRMELIFRGDDQFLVRKKFGPFHNLDIWRPEETERNNLVPLLPFLNMVAHSTIASLEEFAIVLSKTLAFPPSLMPNMQLFMRGHHDAYLQTALADASERIIAGKSLLPQTNA